MISDSIIKAVKIKERQAFKKLYESSIAYVYTIVRRYITNESEIPDVIQEIYARVFLSLATFDASKGEFKSWLRRLVINQCFQHYRQGKSPKLFVALDATQEIGSEENDWLHQLTKEEIERMLNAMPEGYRQVFMLIIIDEYTHKEVGELLNISPETSRSQLSRAKNWLRKKNLTNNTKKIANGLRL